MAGGQERRRRGHARQARCRTRPGPARGDGAAPGAAAAPAHRVGGCGAALDCSWRAADSTARAASTVRAAIHAVVAWRVDPARSGEHTSELQSQAKIVCRLLLEKKKRNN